MNERSENVALTTDANDAEFRTLLNWRMCSDPFPEGVNIQIIDDWIERLCQQRGYSDFATAYHEAPTP